MGGKTKIRKDETEISKKGKKTKKEISKGPQKKVDSPPKTKKISNKESKAVNVPIHEEIKGSAEPRRAARPSPTDAPVMPAARAPMPPRAVDFAKTLTPVPLAPYKAEPGPAAEWNASIELSATVCAQGCKALLEHLSSQQPATNSVVESRGSPVYLTVTLQRLPTAVPKAFPIRIPNNLFSEDSRGSLIVLKDAEIWRDLLQDELPNVEVIGLRQLKKELSPGYTAQADFVMRHDTIVADSRVENQMLHVLGKHAIRRKTFPGSVKLDVENPKKVVGAFKNRTWLRIVKSPTIPVQIGFSSFSSDALIANALEAAHGVKRFFSGRYHMRCSMIKSFELEVRGVPAIPLAVNSDFLRVVSPERRRELAELDKREKERIKAKAAAESWRRFKKSRVTGFVE